MTTAPGRAPNSAVLPAILDRWSPRAYQPTDINLEDLLGFLDAGRWAPSAYNIQPWRFIYARRNTPDWDRFLSWLIPFNRSWAENASAIVYIASRTITISSRTGEPSPLPTHAFDAGAASVLIQIQASQAGWAVHPISGFDRDLAHAGLEFPEDYQVHAALVIGRQGDAGALSEELREREQPSGRFPLAEIAFEGRFRSNE
ncbi:nitroreductase [Gluconobacter thailandicus F149-1 = NBRC 100600]|uniref:Nitroreductase n=1 Tax=Gluconobacter thailandicus NBRC 3257 TaxID=1381097 RepID=A0ABQ0J197_GLUTH|nr:nitroreductase family protein [Gluconobacter thailandicus]AFW02496.1 Nitroreductase [Gluconobacter oxydans H24]ANQ42005.1 nitroreductase [Gluconobacter oxydans]GAN91757.1 nitroreductase [Gluconobacter frateurii M-2]KXV35271.1 nitroreductase [Gluconobacter thailandicus]KXV54728.1 nitroreductase [Gluconobacter thailandicus]